MEQEISLDSHLVRLLMPHRHNMALLDRVESFSVEQKKLIGSKYITRNEAVLEGHFPECPIFPPTLIIEALAQAAGATMNLLYTAAQGASLDRLHDAEYVASLRPPPLSVLAESRIQQTARVRPGSLLRLEAQLLIQRKEICYFEVAAWVGETAVANGTMVLAYPPYVPGSPGGPTL